MSIEKMGFRSEQPDERFDAEENIERGDADLSKELETIFLTVDEILNHYYSAPNPLHKSRKVHVSNQCSQSSYQKYGIHATTLQNVQFLKDKLRQATKLDVVSSDVENNKLEVRVKFPFLLYESASYGLQNTKMNDSGEAILSISQSADNELFISLQMSNAGMSYLSARREYDNASKNFRNEITRPDADYAKQLDSFTSMSTKDKMQLTDEADSIYSVSISQYTKIYKNIQDKQQQLNSFRAIYKTLTKFSNSDSETISNLKSHLIELNESDRRLFPEIKDWSLNDVNRKIGEVEKQIIDQDKNRFYLHRLIEAFAYQCLLGRDKAAVRWDIKKQIESLTSEIIPLTEQIYCTPDKNGNYSIAFGDGAEMATERVNENSYENDGDSEDEEHEDSDDDHDYDDDYYSYSVEYTDNDYTSKVMAGRSVV